MFLKWNRCETGIYLWGSALGISLFISFLCVYKYFELQLSFAKQISIQVDPANFLFSVLNLIIILFVLRKLNKKDDEGKEEKKLIIKYLEDFQLEYTNKIYKFLSDNKVQIEELANFLKSEYSKLDILSEILKKYFPDSSEQSSVLKDNFLELTRSLTFTSAIEGDEKNIIVRNKFITYTNSKKNTIYIELAELKKKTFDLIFSINRK
jgi:hypothetical protein